MGDRIELLDETLIERFPELTREVLAASTRLARPLGWHYVLDLVWVLSRLDLPSGSTILDAGAGYGLLQFLLADRGYRVVSADGRARQLPWELRRLYSSRTFGTTGRLDSGYFADQGLPPQRLFYRMLGNLANVRVRELPTFLKESIKARDPAPATTNIPTILFYRCDLADMREIDDNTFDAVVSISALEHNTPDKLKSIVTEIERVAKTAAPILLTVSSCRDGMLFHKPSSSWLLDERRLVETYRLREVEASFESFEKTLGSLQRSVYLRRWLDLSYYHSDQNGMPWGVWDPQYLPTGIHKTNSPRTVAS